MIERIIFDLDDTLISWKNEYYKTFNKILDELNYQYDETFIKKLIEAVDDYESIYKTYNKKDMLDLMSKYTKIKLPDNFIDLWLEELSSCCELASDDIIETLDYLYYKYDLVILTNWFAYSQINRLKRAGIFKYFSNVYCSDTFLIKPNKESYLTAAGLYNVSKCLMIGDNVNDDVEGALKVGMNAIYYNYKNKKNTNYKEINNLKQLISLL